MRLTLKKNNFYDLINIRYKVYYPLNKFVSFDDFQLILSKYQLKNKKFFPFPIYLSVSKSIFNKIKNKKFVHAYYKNIKVCNLKIKSIFKLNKFKEGQNMFGVKNSNHPGFKKFLEEGEYFLDCSIKNFNTKVMKKINFTYPSNTKKLFKSLNLKKIAGFHTRNVPHKAHEWIHKYGLKICGALFIQPMIGQFKKNEFR